MGRPGIMIYFDLLPAIRRLSDANRGILMLAILEYGATGAEPVLDETLSIVWELIKPRIDKDAKEYEEVVLRRQYATACRERKKQNEPEISFQEWLKMIGRYHMISHDTNDDQWYPTTTPTPTTSTTTSTTSTTAAAATTTTNAPAEQKAAAAQIENLKMMHGKLGKGVVALTDRQIEDLLDRLGVDVFDHYVDKLSTFIINQGARVTNHYETILKWVAEDSALRSERERQRQRKAVPKGCGELGQAEMEAIQRVLAKKTPAEG